MGLIARWWLKIDKTGPVAVTDDPTEAHEWAASWPDGFKRDVIEVAPSTTTRGGVEALRVIANDTTHDGRWAAGRAEAALVAMGVDPRPGGQ